MWKRWFRSKETGDLKYFEDAAPRTVERIYITQKRAEVNGWDIKESCVKLRHSQCMSPSSRTTRQLQLVDINTLVGESKVRIMDQW